MKKINLSVLAWVLAAAAVFVAIYVWGDLYNWRLVPLSNYQLFPLFGLLAFSLMWTHYMVGAIRLYTAQDNTKVKGYFELTSAVVLLTLLLHPSLLVGQLFLDGHGLPPQSYLENYVAPDMGWVVLIGSVSLVAFLLFELRHFYKDRSWWKYIVYASDVAMLGVFYHGLRLGSHLQSGWFVYLWFFYGASLLASIIYLRLIYKPS